MTILKTVLDTLLEVLAEHKPDLEPEVHFDPTPELWDQNVDGPAIAVIHDFKNDNVDR